MNRSFPALRLPSVEGKPNVTPLVDVALVLLVVFMVVAPMLDRRGDVVLPRTAAPPTLATEPPELSVSVRWPDRTTWVEDSWLPLPELKVRLARERAGQERRVVVRVDERLAFAAVRPVLRTLREAGYPGASLGARRLEPR